MLNRFAGKITVDLEVLDREIQACECITEVKARGVKLSDILVREGKPKR
jgi:hypothetical protein